MKDAVVTVRLPRRTRHRIEQLARQEGRSLSQAIERLLAQAMGDSTPAVPVRRPRGARRLAGVLAGGRVPTLAEFKEVRPLLSGALRRRVGAELRR